MSGRSSRSVREEIGHPVIDVDGHFVEMAPVLHEEIVATLEELGGAALRDRYLASRSARPTRRRSSRGARSAACATRGPRCRSWWGWPVENVRDRATAHLPALLYERLDELGIDFTVLYPSMTLSFLDVGDAELAPALCRATNRLPRPRVREVPRPHDGRRADPDAHTRDRRRRAALRGRGARIQGGRDRGVRPPTDRQLARGRRAHRRLPARPLRHRQRLRLRPVLADVRRPRRRRRRCTARCSTTASRARCRATSTTTSAASRRATSRWASRCSSAA